MVHHVPPPPHGAPRTSTTPWCTTYHHHPMAHCVPPPPHGTPPHSASCNNYTYIQYMPLNTIHHLSNHWLHPHPHSNLVKNQMIHCNVVYYAHTGWAHTKVHTRTAHTHTHGTCMHTCTDTHTYCMHTQNTGNLLSCRLQTVSCHIHWEHR